jgi:outer membrane protein OmpA-like peptidoglycan-associated protein
MKFNEFVLMTALSVSLTFTAVAQADNDSAKKPETRPSRVASGQKQKVTGVIVRRDPDSFIMRDMNGAESTVTLTSATKVVERKSNPFRGARQYGVTSLLRGLYVEVEGRGDSGGNLSAEKIRFTDDEFRTARSIESRVTPVEGRVGDAETRITQTEQNAQRLSGQMQELSEVANLAKGSAMAAQGSADAAIAGVNVTNQRISMIDDYEPRRSTSVSFKVGSHLLSPEAMTALDEIAGAAKTEKGFVIEVAGYASADGNLQKNRELSQRRADSVVRYLVETHNIPPRRVITPFGYGVSNPIADNATLEGRQQNRRVEVRILVSKGLTTSPAPVTRPSTSDAGSSQRSSVAVQN